MLIEPSQTRGVLRQLAEHRAGVAAIAVAVVIGFAMPLLIEFGAAESYATRPAMQPSDYALGFVWAGLMTVSVVFWPIRSSMKSAVLWAWLFRVSITLFALLPYFHHYPALDLYEYFADRATAPSLADTAFGSSVKNITTLTRLIHEVSPDSFHAMNVTFSMFGLIGIYQFWLASEAFLGYGSIAVFYVLAFEPSLTFWTAALGKDALMLLGVGLYTRAVVAWWRTGRTADVASALGGILLVALMRPWMVAILIVPLIVLCYGLQHRLTSRIVTTIVAVTAVVFLYPFLMSLFYVQVTKDITQQVVQMAGRFNLGEASPVPILFYGPTDIIKFAPIGMFSALFRPLPGDVLNPFGLLASAENILLLGLATRALVRSRWSDLKDPIVGWAVCLIGLWAFAYAFVSSQNFGTAVRYRTQVFPILLGLMLYLGRRSGAKECSLSSSILV